MKIFKPDNDIIVNLQVSEEEIIFISDSLDDLEKTLIINDNLDDGTAAFIELFRYRLDQASRKFLKELEKRKKWTTQ